MIWGTPILGKAYFVPFWCANQRHQHHHIDSWGLSTSFGTPETGRTTSRDGGQDEGYGWHMEVSIVMGVPQNRLLIMENPIKMDDSGVPPVT
jgi:hypothetical protein